MHCPFIPPILVRFGPGPGPSIALAMMKLMLTYFTCAVLAGGDRLYHRSAGASAEGMDPVAFSSRRDDRSQ